MSNAVIFKGEKKTQGLNYLQKTFNGCKKRIEILQKECLECTKTLNRHLDFYYQALAPKERELTEVMKKEIKLIDPYLKDGKNLNKENRRTLKDLVIRLFGTITDLERDRLEFDEELSHIYKKITGSSLQEEQAAEFEKFKNHMERMYAQKGAEIDLSDVKMESSREETLSKLFESIENQTEFMEKEEEAPPTAKSKKQLEKERKALDLEALQRKEIGAVYKQLVKVLHPDLEPDPGIKLEKQEIMKKLTTAYESRDLYTVLSLEIEHLPSDDRQITRSDDLLKLYNRLLQTQIIKLQEELCAIPARQEYGPLRAYTRYHWKKGDAGLMQIQEEMRRQIHQHEITVKQMQSDRAVGTIKGLIRGQEMLEDRMLAEEFGGF